MCSKKASRPFISRNLLSQPLSYQNPHNLIIVFCSFLENFKKKIYSDLLDLVLKKFVIGYKFYHYW